MSSRTFKGVHYFRKDRFRLADNKHVNKRRERLWIDKGRNPATDDKRRSRIAKGVRIKTRLCKRLNPSQLKKLNKSGKIIFKTDGNKDNRKILKPSAGFHRKGVGGIFRKKNPFADNFRIPV